MLQSHEDLDQYKAQRKSLSRDKVETLDRL